MDRPKLQYNVLFRAEPEGGYTAIVPSLPGCISYGRDLAETKKMIQDAIGGYLVSLKKHREPIPSDNNNFISSLIVPSPPRARNRSKTYA